MNRGLFLDRDGTIIEDVGYLSDPGQIRFLPGAPEALAALTAEGWKLFLVSNQSGVGRGMIATHEMDAVQARFLAMLGERGVRITESYLCVHAPDAGCACRKPSTLFLEQAAREHGLDLARSWMIGDREGDILCGRNAGCATIWLRNEMFEVAADLPSYIEPDWDAIYRRLSGGPPGGGRQ